jgi:ATP adenylyltransferase
VGPGDDRRRLVVARTALTVTVMNRFPYNNGHLLVAPQRHCGTLAELRREERLELMDILTRMVEVLKTILSPEGFNIGLNLGAAAGAGLPDHLHWHIVPRWVGDTSFMTCLASVRVIPQALEALWERLQEELK